MASNSCARRIYQYETAIQRSPVDVYLVLVHGHHCDFDWLWCLFPSMNLVAKPFVCPSGKMDLSRETYHPYPGNTITTITWYCMDEASGAKKELGSFPMSLYSGTIYGWLLFGIVVAGMMILAKRGQAGVRAPVNRTFETPHNQPYRSENVVARMKELKELRAANLISEDEYEEKRAEILKSL